MKKRLIFLIVVCLSGLTSGMKVYYPELIEVGKKYSYYEYRMVKFDVDQKQSVYGKNIKFDDALIDVVTLSDSKVMLIEENNRRDTYIYDFKKDSLDKINYNVAATNRGVWMSFQDTFIIVGTPLKEIHLNYPTGCDFKNIDIHSSWITDTDSLIVLYFNVHEKRWVITVNVHKMSTIENEVNFEMSALSLTGSSNNKIEHSPDKKKVAIHIYNKENPKQNIAIFELESLNVTYFDNVESFQWYSDTELIFREEYGSELKILNLLTGERKTVFKSKCLSGYFHYSDNSVFDFCSQTIIEYFYYKAKFIRVDISNGKRDDVLVFKKDVAIYYNRLRWDWYK